MATSFIPIQRGSLTDYAPTAKGHIPKFMVLDMNSFFASCEQQANPFFRNRPVGVVASMHPTSCLIAASKEAKARGIKTGTLIRFAKQICPDLILLKSEPEKYREVSAGFNRIIRDYTDQVERYSIDESFIDFRGTGLNPLQVGAEIKQRIRDEVGEWLTCSVGIGDNKFLAKLASEQQKPDGLSVIWRENLRQVYVDKKFTDLWGIARGWTNRLARISIIRPAQLLDYPVQNLISLFGKPGFYIWRRVNGLEEDEIQNENDAPKSFGHSWVLNFRSTDKKRLGPVILRLAEKASRRMRRENYEAQGFYLSLRCVNDDDSFFKHKKLKFSIKTGSDLYEQSMFLWQNLKIGSEVSHIAVGFTDLKVTVNQLSLFKDKTDDLIFFLDQINNKYGEFAIRSGLLTNTKTYAPDAIAFGL